MKVRYVLAGLLGLSLSARAGHTEGNCGYTYRHGGRLVLLDFFEADLEVRETCSGYSTPANLPAQIDAETGCHLAERLAILSAKYPRLGWIAGQTLSLYQWNFVEEDLRDIGDLRSRRPLDPTQLHLTALRRGRQILVRSPLFAELSPAHRAGLLFHEIFYSLLEPEPQVDRDGVPMPGYFLQDTQRARDLTASLFRDVNDLPIGYLASLLKRPHPDAYLPDGIRVHELLKPLEDKVFLDVLAFQILGPDGKPRPMASACRYPTNFPLSREMYCADWSPAAYAQLDHGFLIYRMSYAYKLDLYWERFSTFDEVGLQSLVTEYPRPRWTAVTVDNEDFRSPIAHPQHSFEVLKLYLEYLERPHQD